MLTPFYLWELRTIGGFTVTTGVATSFVYLAICPSVLAYLCWNQGVNLAGANRAGLFINLLPVFAAVLAVLLLGEAVQWFHMVGMGLVFGGMVLFNRSKVRGEVNIQQVKKDPLSAPNAGGEGAEQLHKKRKMQKTQREER